jgi:hypothetical protein
VPKKPTLKSTKTKLDKLLRDIVKERADWTCEACGIKSEDPYFMQWSHHLSCRYYKTRWHPENAACHCGKCHERFTGDPVAHRKEIIRLIGDGMYTMLRQRIDDSSTKPPNVSERLEMIEHYKIQLAELEIKRKDGVQGYIDIVSWD